MRPVNRLFDVHCHPRRPTGLRSLWVCLVLLLGMAAPANAVAADSESPPLLHHLSVSSSIHASSLFNVRYRELVVALRLPWKRAINSHWQLETMGLLGIGKLTGKGVTGLVYNMGFQAAILPHHFGLYLTGASRVAVLQKPHLNGVNLGSPLQFLSFAEAGWLWMPRLSTGIRILHISNGGITDINPGINLISVVINIHP